ncbi:DnaJ subfamily C member 1 [Mactra antiquata]
MSTSGCIRHHNFQCFLVFLLLSCAVCWDTDNLELYDLVEEINQNFYEVLGVSRDASSGEIKKAYRKKTLVLHPDKNEAEDAEEKFRQLVAVYEVLKDDEKREKYNHVLDYGLPDWRQPVFYYRKARKLGLAELFLLLCIIITIGQYFVLWAVYLERRLALEDFFQSKKKKETKKKKCKAATLNEQLDEDLHETLLRIPKPSFRRLWPFTFTVWSVKTVISLPSTVREWREKKRLIEEWKKLEKEEREKQEALYREELELRKQKRKMKAEPRVLPTVTTDDSTPVVYEQLQSTNETAEGDSYKQSVKDGAWTDEDFVLLSKAYVRFPGGTSNRWEKIADMVGRPVSEVTAQCKKMKGNLQMNLSSSVQGGTKSSKKQIEISDDIISTLGPDDNTSSVDSNQNDNTVRKRNRQKGNKDSERTLMISGHNSKNSQTGAQNSSQKVEPLSKKSDNQSTVSNSNTTDGKLVLKTKGDSNSETKVKLDENNDPESWSQNQQVILEWTLKQYPKGTDQRWEKIAEHIPGKTKEDCVARFKYLADIVKQKRQQQQQS